LSVVCPLDEPRIHRCLPLGAETHPPWPWEERHALARIRSILAQAFELWYTCFMSTPLSIRTICCKLALDAAAEQALSQTQAAFNRAASYCASVAWQQGVTNKNKLHFLVYREARLTYGLGAQLACCARDKAAEAVRATRSREAELKQLDAEKASSASKL